MTELTSARDLFRAAYENRYTWDAKQFPGYNADITLKKGDTVYSGNIRINPDLSYEVLEVSDESGREEINGQLWEIAIHRIRKPFEEVHGQNEFTLGETTETGAVEILVSGKAMGDRYNVQNNVVTLVHRQIRDVIVTIHTFSTHDTGEGYLSHRYDSTYHDRKTGELKGTSQFDDNYEKVGNYYVLTSRVIQSQVNGNSVTTDIAFLNVKLLEPVAV
jgi:hypothetical protein